MERLRTLEWVDDHLCIIDQTCLPAACDYHDLFSIDDTVEAIKVLRIRGAPAIGVAASYGFYLGITHYADEKPVDAFLDECRRCRDILAAARPTAVNLFWSLARMIRCAETAAANGEPIVGIKQALLNEAHTILEEDRSVCRAIGEHGFQCLSAYTTLLTHCNAGSLATADFGTALAPVYIGQEKGHLFTVYADETRPLLQGARITAFELHAAGIPVVLLCDSMAGVVLSEKKVDAVIVGADRIAANGDVANKIGTYSLALLAQAHGIPFFVAAPLSTFDCSLANGSAIPIEQRSAEEITCFFGRQTAPEGITVFNPAFDVTPHSLITAIITERGIIHPPFEPVITEWCDGETGDTRA